MTVSGAFVASIVSAAVITAASATTALAAADPVPFYPGSWTMVVLPDVQNYNGSDAKTLDFQRMTQWIADNKAARNIRFVTSVGDLTNNNAAAQWTRARAGFAKLDGVVPYAPVLGNHDYGSNGSANVRTTQFNTYFKPTDNPLNDPAQGGALKGTRHPGALENAYYTFAVGQRNYMVLNLEWSPRDGTVAWAEQVVAAHPNHRVMLVMHAYLYSDDTRYDFAAKGAAQTWSPYSYGTANDPDGVNDGEELWQKLAKKYQNISLVQSGHVLNDEVAYRSDAGDFGNVVHQMLYNRQLQDDGQLRLIEFHPDGTHVQVKTYSPLLDQWRTDSAGQFSIAMSQIPEPAGAAIGGGVVGTMLLCGRGGIRARRAFGVR